LQTLQFTEAMFVTGSLPVPNSLNVTCFIVIPFLPNEFSYVRVEETLSIYD